MIIATVRELKTLENRVGLTPDGVAVLVGDGHRLLVESGAGLGAGFSDEDYRRAGAAIVDADHAWRAELVVKVKEPLASEYPRLSGQILFAFLHLSGVPKSLTEALLASGTTAIAYETVTDVNGRLPLLAPMSAVAGNMAVTVGAWYLARINGGKGVQLGRVQGERHGRVLVIGDGVVGRHAAAVAAGMGAAVVIAGRHPERREELRRHIHPAIDYLPSTPTDIANQARAADLVVGAVLLPGARAPRVVTGEMVAGMEAGSVIVDVSIDQGGCVETSRPTSHADPVFRVHDVIHYCVTNMPGAYPRTATMALTAATLPYVRTLAAGGLPAVATDEHFRHGVNTHRGRITSEPVARALGMTDVFSDSFLPQTARISRKK
ncbi:MAG: alanine dehydrogenase [Thermodesulfobacteriota bacterium]